VNPTYSLFLLRWFAEHRPDAAAGAVAFTDVGSYVAGRLAGLAAEPVMDHSHASRTGFFDVRTRSFDGDALAWAGDWTDKAPRLVPSGRVIGDLAAPAAERLGLPGAVAVMSGAHDHFAAAFASGVRGAGDAMLSVGTSEALFVLVNELPDDLPGDVDLGAFVDERTYYLHRNVRGGQLFSRWRDLLRLTASEPTWFEPPTWDARSPLMVIDGAGSTATLANVPFAVEPADLMRVLSEGLAVNARRMLKTIEVAAGRPVRTLTVAGPAGEQDAWLRMRAAILGRPLRVVRTPEPTALGAALLAQRGMRGHADTPVATHVVEPPTEPGPRGYYQTLLAAYAEAAGGTSAS
jgi:xylulokinase